MSNYYKTRTVRTYVSDGSGKPRVETKTYTLGGPGGSSVGFTSDFGDFGNFGSRGLGDFGGQFNIDLGDAFGGKTLNFDIGGGGNVIKEIGSGGRGGGSRPYPDQRSGGGGGGGGYGPRPVTISDPDPQPKLAGRPTRTLRKNPFVTLKLQNINEIKSKCAQQGVLFEDPEFPAVDSSLFFSRSPPRRLEWKRPHVSFYTLNFDVWSSSSSSLPTRAHSMWMIMVFLRSLSIKLVGDFPSVVMNYLLFRPSSALSSSIFFSPLSYFPQFPCSRWGIYVFL